MGGEPPSATPGDEIGISGETIGGYRFGIKRVPLWPMAGLKIVTVLGKTMRDWLPIADAS
jgi:hypothetical protein